MKTKKINWLWLDLSSYSMTGLEELKKASHKEHKPVWIFRMLDMIMYGLAFWGILHVYDALETKSTNTILCTISIIFIVVGIVMTLFFRWLCLKNRDHNKEMERIREKIDAEIYSRKKKK